MAGDSYGKSGGSTGGSDGCYVPNGEVQGDSTGMPNRGTSTGVTDTYGADLSQGADNRMGSIRGSTGSDKGDQR
jgi:hypothetical protein